MTEREKRLQAACQEIAPDLYDSPALRKVVGSLDSAANEGYQTAARVIFCLTVIRSGLVDVGRIRALQARSDEQAKRMAVVEGHLQKAASLAGLPVDYYLTGEGAPKDLAARIRRGLHVYQVPFASEIDAHAGTRGAAATSDAATRGVAIRMLDEALPAELSGRFSLIATLLAFAGINVTRQIVRSILDPARAQTKQRASTVAIPLWAPKSPAK